MVIKRDTAWLFVPDDLDDDGDRTLSSEIIKADLDNDDDDGVLPLAAMDRLTSGFGVNTGSHKSTTAGMTLTQMFEE